MEMKRKTAVDNVEPGSTSRIDEEVVGGKFNDSRLDRRFAILLEQLGGSVGQTIPFSCEDWANTKAAYRFISNPKVNEADILSGHFGCTQNRFGRLDGLALVLHDTTEFSYKRENVAAIGITKSVQAGASKKRTVDEEITRCAE